MFKETITSLTNVAIKQAVALRDAKNRREHGLTLIDGVREIERALLAKIKLERVFVCPSFLAGREAEKILAIIKKELSDITSNNS